MSSSAGLLNPVALRMRLIMPGPPALSITSHMQLVSKMATVFKPRYGSVQRSIFNKPQAPANVYDVTFPGADSRGESNLALLTSGPGRAEMLALVGVGTLHHCVWSVLIFTTSYSKLHYSHSTVPLPSFLKYLIQSQTLRFCSFLMFSLTCHSIYHNTLRLAGRGDSMTRIRGFG